MTGHDPTRRAILAGLAASLAGPALGGGVPIPPPRPAGLVPSAVAAPAVVATGTEARLIAEARLGGGAGVALIDAATGETLAEAQGGAPLPPASSLKALTALYALDALGADHRFATRILATGAVQGGTLAGDLVLAGGGDPALDADDLARLAAACVAAGITRVGGRFVFDDGQIPEIARIDPTQPAQAGYNPGVGASTSTTTACISNGRARARGGRSRSMRAASTIGRRSRWCASRWWKTGRGRCSSTASGRGARNGR